MTDESSTPMPDSPSEPEAAVEAAPAVEAAAVESVVEPAEPVAEIPPAPAAEPAPLETPPAYVPPAPVDAPPPPPAAPVAPQAEPMAPPAPDQPAYAPPPPPAPGYTAPTAPPPQPAYAAPVAPASDKQKMVAGILAILLGSLGIHKFYLGYQKEGIIMLAVTIVGGLFTFGLASAAMSVIGLVEGIMYLMKTDEEFYATYVAGQKAWF